MITKFSAFNHFIKKEDKNLLYNANSDEVINLVPELAALIQENKETTDNIKNIHPELFSKLLEKHFIVSTDEDELKTIINKWEKEDNNDNNFGIIINPTLDCNLHCWYCYERHKPGMDMKPSTLDAIKTLIINKLKNTKIRQLTLSFFGGEPLLQYFSVVQPLISFAMENCNQHNVLLIIAFTTNGVLLNKSIIEDLSSYQTKIPISFQITLDGNEEVHNKIRHTKDGQPTFDKIIDNIKILVSHDMVVNIRLNYTNKSIPTFVDIIEEFKTLSKEENSRISFDFQKVWQDISTVTTSKKLEELRKWFKEERLSVNCSAKFMKSRCYADKCNNLLVNYDGSVYKCSARDFNVENREGVLLTDGTIDWNDKYKYRMSIKYGNNTCHNCSIFPICHGGCSQDKKESAFKEKCIFNYSESDKKNIIIERINELFK